VTDHYLKGPWQRARGVIGREPGPEERYIFEYDEPQILGVHMLGVRQPLLVTWLLDGSIEKEKVLMPWRGHGKAFADTVIEQQPRYV
jgi:Uncharacterized ACR, COG1430.